MTDKGTGDLHIVCFYLKAVPGKEKVSQGGSTVYFFDCSSLFCPCSTQVTQCKQQSSLTNGGYCRDGEEERANEVPSPQTGGVALEGETTLIGLDDTLQRNSNENGRHHEEAV